MAEGPLMIDLIHPTTKLMRGFAVDYLTCHDMEKLPEIIHPDYRLTIAGVVFDGRDASYRPAAIGQLSEFPGLIVTTHDLMIGTDCIAFRYTEHGASRRYSDHRAAWGGITLFRLRDGQIHEGWSESDYYARKLQLKSGKCDMVQAPHPAPWDAQPLPPNGDVEAAVREWLTDPTAIFGNSQAEEICSGGVPMRKMMTPTEVKLTTLASAGDRAAFHLFYSGFYCGGLDEVDNSMVGTPVMTGISGLVAVRDGKVRDIQYATDRLGLSRRLLDQAKAA